MDATCKIQGSIHVFGLIHKCVSRILGIYYFFIYELFTPEAFT